VLRFLLVISKFLKIPAREYCIFLQYSGFLKNIMATDPKITSSVNTTKFPTKRSIELVFGLVGPVGVDLTQVGNTLSDQLRAVGYEAVFIVLSDLIKNFYGHSEFDNKFDRIDTLMNDGNKLREKQLDIVARMGIAEIRRLRKEETGESSKISEHKKIAYIIKSFKRPEEVSLYRSIYGKSFTLISVYSSKASRIQSLTRILSSKSKNDETAEELAVRLVKKDYQEESNPSGQRVGKTFPLADFFVASEPKPVLSKQLQRLVRLTFGDPYISPTRDEQGMFFAQAAAMRSLDLSRQVGSAIINLDGDIVSTGCNEVPKFGGGLYWEDDESPDRDYERGEDANVMYKIELFKDLIQRLRGDENNSSWLSDEFKSKTDDELINSALMSKDAFLKESKLFDVIEFGRAVHAEMAAISQAAKNGTSLQGTRLFCTTFPCHLCARHIVASGIREVVFIEPYEKSKTAELFSDSIAVEPHELSNTKANFKPFIGVAPRRYMDNFQVTTKRKTDDGKILNQNNVAREPKLKRVVLTYLSIEDDAVQGLIFPDPSRTEPQS
jgi:deoxycytidylate deaminase